MSDLYTHLASYSFHLSNGAEWRVLAADRAAETILERLAEVMTLRRVSDCRQNHSVQTVFVRVSDVPRMKMGAYPAFFQWRGRPSKKLIL